VSNVSWEDAKAYCAWLAGKCRRPIRLPSEAEWECACRARGDGEFTFGDDEETLSEYGWIEDRWESGAKAVGTRWPNRWGLRDLHGNVWEWCEDTWHESYDGAPADGSPWVDTSTDGHVVRGGCWFDTAVECRSAARNWYVPTFRIWDIGFRPAFVLTED